MSENKCVCGFVAKNLAGLKSHQRACVIAGKPMKDQLWLAVDQAVESLDSEIAADAAQTTILAEQYQTYMMVYSAMKVDVQRVSPKNIEEHLQTTPGTYRDLYLENKALRKMLFGKAPDGKLHKPHPDHPLMKQERAQSKELKRMLDAACKTIKSQWSKLVHDRLPDRKLLNLVLLNYELYASEAQNQGGSNE